MMPIPKYMSAWFANVSETLFFHDSPGRLQRRQAIALQMDKTMPRPIPHGSAGDAVSMLHTCMLKNAHIDMRQIWFEIDWN